MMNFTFLNFLGINKNKAWQSLLVFAFLIFGLGGFAQNTHSSNKAEIYSDDLKPFKVVSFGDKIFFGNIENTANWTIANPLGVVVANLTGSQINDFVFKDSGFYEIRFFENKKQESEGCNHSPFPETMLVKVNSVKMKFDFSKIQFSSKLKKGISCDDISITVPVNITINDHTPKKYKYTSLVVSGFSAEIVTKSHLPDIVVKDGIQFLKNHLTGIVTNETYLMFDFIDFNDQA
jgi:hypothetical protein